jgi:hypothetical protein
MVKNEIYDPCVSSSASDTVTAVVCATAPWESAYLLRLTSKLPLQAGNQPSGAGLTAWAVELANGDRCVVGTGTNSQLPGVTLGYYCHSGLAGQLVTDVEPWTIQYNPNRTSTLESLDVTTAWKI